MIETETEKNREGDMFAVLLKEIQEGNNTLSQKIDSKTADLQTFIENLHLTMSSLLGRVMEDKQCIGDTEDEVRRIDGLMKKIRQENETLKEKEIPWKLQQMQQHSGYEGSQRSKRLKAT